MHKPFASAARWIGEMLASPWALAVALTLIAVYLIAGPRLGFPDQRLDLSFFITFTTFLLVFVIEHQGYRDRAAMQVKLDEVIRVLDADRSKIGIEERPPQEIDSVRDSELAREGQRRVG